MCEIKSCWIIKKGLHKHKTSDIFNSKKWWKCSIISHEKNDSISGGEKQRIAIERLLNENFDCILLDESTSSLDKNSVDIVEECIL